MRSHILVIALTTALGLSSTGCIKKMMLDGQIQATRQGATSADTIGDFEIGRGAAEAGLAQFEGMHALSPDNADALYLLTKTWAQYAYAFAEDDMEVAQDASNEELADAQRKRARMGYDRAIFYGLQLLGQTDDGFEKARKSQDSIDKWLKDHFTSKDDAGNLFWTGYAWLARAGLMQSEEEGPQFVADLYVAVSMLQRAVDLDPSAEHYSGVVALAAYHARSNLAELDEAKKLFDEAIAKTGGKSLMADFAYATRYACVKGDAALYQTTLNKVVAAQNPDPEQAASNGVAKRRAKRWLGKRRAKDQCGIDLGGGASAGDAASAPSTPAPAASPSPTPATPTPDTQPAETPVAPPAKKPARHKPTAMKKPAAATTE